MRIGSYNLFEVGSIVESSDVGDMNEFGVKSSVAANCQIGNGCYINPCVAVPMKSNVPSHSVYIEPGVIAQDNQLRADLQRTNCKEISALLSESIPQHLKTQVLDANGKWQTVDVQPKAPSRAGQRPGSKQGGGVSARGGTSARGDKSARTTAATAAAAGQTPVRTKLPKAADAEAAATQSTKPDDPPQ